METSETQALAVVIGASGGLGCAFVQHLQSSSTIDAVIGFSRSSEPPLDLTSEASIAAAARLTAEQAGELRLVIDATGFLHDADFGPERSWRHLNAERMARAFALNAIGPALLMKHFLPLFPKGGKSVFATLSAKVGSIEDNRFGGWYSYRASKAALNQFVRTAGIELQRKRPEAICVALHPGTVDTALSAPFSKAGLTVQPPEQAAGRLLTVLGSLTAEANGGFYDYKGERLPW